MLRPRMTLQVWMIAIACVAVLLELTVEWQRGAHDQHGPGYHRARAVFAMREPRRTSRGYRTDDACVIFAVAATAVMGVRLRRRWLGLSRGTRGDFGRTAGGYPCAKAVCRRTSAG